jgi:hypothetical protein
MKKMLFIALSLSFLILGNAEASLVAYEFSGTITGRMIRDSNDPVGGVVNGIIANSSTFSSTFSYDTSTSASSSDSEGVHYPANSFSIVIDNTYSFTALSPEILIINNGVPGDRFVIRALNSPISSDVIADYMFLYLTGPTSVFGDSSLPELSLADFTSANGIIVSNKSLSGLGDDSDSYIIFGNPTSQTVIPVPTTILLLGSGFVGLVGLRKKFKK